MARGSISTEVSDLRRELNELNTLLNKMVATNINLQSKLTESVIKMNDLMKEVKDMVELLQVATEMESGPSEVRGLSDMNEAMQGLNKNVQAIEDYLKKIYRRIFMLSQANAIKKQGYVQRSAQTPASQLSANPLLEKQL